MNKWVKLIISILICQMAGVVGFVFTTPSLPTLYAGLQKPAFAPPNWLFGPVWITLYTLMGISLYLAWEEGRKKAMKIPLSLFSIQLLLNAIWSPLFAVSSFYALIEIIILWVAILFTIVTFYKVSKKAGMLLLPYILWVSIATALNYYIWILNI